MNLSDSEKQRVLALIQNGEKLPKEFIYKLFADDEDVFLFWNGRKEAVTNVVLPFHSIEHIDEPRKEKERSGDAIGFFDTRGRQLQGWTNKLIWGDNKLILSSLANGALREDIEREGGLKLIYIDPPFAVGADFGFNIEIGGETAEKKQTVIEEIAYRDTWGKGISSYLSMMYERLKLMHTLLADDGSIYVHCDGRVSSYLKLLLDDIFHNYRNEIVWQRDAVGKGAKKTSSQWSRELDCILFFTKSDTLHHFEQLYKLSEELTHKTLKEFRYSEEDGRLFKIVTLGDYSEQSIAEMRSQNLIYTTSKGTEYKKYYLDEFQLAIGSLWNDIPNLSHGKNPENLNYPTQKPEALLERIIKASSNEGDLVADFFCGSGTTAAVAEKLGRKWITTDLGRFAVHTARKRLIGVQRELQAGGKDFRAFEVLNLGKYERQFFINTLADEHAEATREAKADVYVNLILEAYKAKRAVGYGALHGTKAGRVVHVGPLDVPVTQALVQEVFEECRKLVITEVDILGFEFEMGLAPFFVQHCREQGVTVNLKYIPKEVFDKRAVEKGHVKFFDVAYLNAKATTKGKTVSIELTDFVTHYTQDDIEEVQASMRSGSKVVIEDGNIIKVEKDKNGIITRTSLTEKWQDWVDYWAVDFDYHSKKEIVKVRNEADETEEQWTGNYLFENEWQSFRTKRNPTLEFTSATHEYPKSGTYKVMVKVVDILGVDTSKIVEVRVS